MITLQKSVTPLPAQVSFKLSLTATSAEIGLDHRVFVFHAGSGEFDEATGVAGDMFAHVASLTNLDEFPPAAPAAVGGDAKPYYRTASVEVVCRSELEVEEVLGKILEDIQELVDCYKAVKGGAIATSTIVIS